MELVRAAYDEVDTHCLSRTMLFFSVLMSEDTTGMLMNSTAGCLPSLKDVKLVRRNAHTAEKRRALSRRISGKNDTEWRLDVLDESGCCLV